jgi:pyrimidine operon attenuation protein / uracil phosphoribosyltransferase
MSRVAMDAEAMEKALERMARELQERARGGELAIVGVRRGGVHLAGRLRRKLAATGREPPLGTLDIALYRDDLSERAAAPVVGPTDIPFSVTGKTIALVDDVLYTGRTVRAALDELVDFGRPRRVLLVVLVDRGGRELPIAADVVGLSSAVPEAEQVEVRLVEAGAARDEVVVQGRGTP